MNLYEVTYKSDDGKERKVRVVASFVGFAIMDAYKRKHPGRKKEIVSVVDQGVVSVAESHKGLGEALVSRTIQVGAVMDAIDKELANIEADLERHRKTMDRVAKLKERLASNENVLK